MGNSASRKLIRAAKRGDLDKVKEYIAISRTGSGRIDLDEQDEDGDTALMISVVGIRCGKSCRRRPATAAVQLLVRGGAALDVQDKYGYTALILAQRYGRLEAVQELVRAGATLDVQDDNGRTALIHAAMHTGYRHPQLWSGWGCDWLNRNAGTMNWLVRAGASLDVQDNRGMTALMQAVTLDCVIPTATVQELIRAGAAIDVQDKNGKTALMWAVESSSSSVATLIQELVRAGAALDVQDKEGWTALMWAVGSGVLRAVRDLVRAGASLDVQREDGYTALMCAVENTPYLARDQPSNSVNPVGIVKELVRAGAAVDLQAEDSKTALACADWGGNAEVIAMLREAGEAGGGGSPHRKEEAAAAATPPLPTVAAVRQKSAAGPSIFGLMRATTEEELLQVFDAILLAPEAILISTMLPRALQRKREVGPEVWTERVSAAYGNMLRELKSRRG
jgi:ankyrin repeat protein